MSSLECAVADFALEYASGKLPASAAQAVKDSLNVGYLCANETERLQMRAALHDVYERLDAEALRHGRARERALAVSEGAVTTFYVSTTGSDANNGLSIGSPFLTLGRAATAARAISPRAPGDVTVFIRSGTYYLGALGPLLLSENDSNVTWAAYPADAPAPVIISGGVSLPAALPWANVSAGMGSVPGILVAPVGAYLPPDERVAHWRASPASARWAAGASSGLRAPPSPLIASLFINGTRQVRARFPNGNPQDLTGLCFSATQRPGEGCTGWSSCATGSTAYQPAPASIATVVGGPPGGRAGSPTMGCSQCDHNSNFQYNIFPPPPDHPVYNKPLPGVGWSNTSIFDFWSSLFSRPANVLVNGDATCDGGHWVDVAANYSNPTGAVLHMFHSNLWGGWMYAVDNVTLVGHNLTINFGYGGFQEAQGSGINAGQHFYIENVFEEIDAPGEWFYNASTGDLYLLPNVSDLAQLTAAELVMPILNEVIIVNGSQTAKTAYATGISFVGLTITQSRMTYLEQYEVPSGGDWSVHRGAALFVQDAEDVSIAGCTFDQVGGNAIIFSNHVVNSSITDNEVVRPGDSAIIFLGSTNGVDGSAPTYPNRNLVQRNHLHEIGIYGKQTSCLGHQLSANSSILDNVCYNGPRAGINWNDGFGGGNLQSGNALWNAVRETGDHGVLNSWSRQPFWTFSGVNDGYNDPAGRSFLTAWDYNIKNLLINGYNGVWTADSDDTTQMKTDATNFMVWGGCKNYIGSYKNCTDNVILYPGIDGRSAGNRRCQTDDNGEFAEQYHEGNTCTSADGIFYTFAGCSADPDNLNTTVYVTAGNTLYADPGATFTQTCNQTLTFEQWQALGQDQGSSVAVTPNVTELIALGANKILS